MIATPTHVYTKDQPVDFQPTFADRAAWERRAAFLRRQVRLAAGLTSPPPLAPLSPTIHGKTVHDGYSVEKVFFASVPGHYVTGSLYRPTAPAARARPAVLHPYGHWPTGRFIWNGDDKIEAAIASGGEAMHAAARSPLQACCVTFARMGCVVFHYDMVGYCDSTALPHAQGFDDADAILRLQSALGLQTINSIRAVDFLASLADVDASRIAVGGASSGGTQTLLLGILDERPAALFIAGMIGMDMQGGCPCEQSPLLRVDTNNVELCALLAPRPTFCCGATGDWTRDWERRGRPQLETIFELCGARDAVDGAVLPYPHNFNQHTRKLFYDFVARTFGLCQGDDQHQCVEREFDALPPEALSVFDAQHPVPLDSADVTTIRRTLVPRIAVRDALETMLDLDDTALDGNAALREAQGDRQIGQATSWQIRSGVRSLTIVLDPSEADENDVPSRHAATQSLIPRRRSATSSQRGDVGIRSDPEDDRALVSIRVALAPLVAQESIDAKPLWFPLVFNRAPMLAAARRVLALVGELRRAHPSAELSLDAGDDLTPLVLILRAARPEWFVRVSTSGRVSAIDDVTSLNDPHLVPGLLAFGGVQALIDAVGVPLVVRDDNSAGHVAAYGEDLAGTDQQG